MMVVLGVDAHKRSHTVVAADPTGAELGSLQVAATSAGHLRALAWAGRFEARRWAIEDCRQVSRGLEADLLGAGETVIRVPPKLMAGARRSARTPGKSDPIDALAVARAALREPDLPRARLAGPAREVKLLLDYRENLIRERTAAQNSLRWRLHELDPSLEPAPGSLDRFATLTRVERFLGRPGGLQAELARREIGRIREITKEANCLATQIARRVARLAPTLLGVPGCGPLSAARLLAEAADITRFSDRRAYASFAGTAPIPAWTAHPGRFRLNRGGNRQTNAALYRIAITQLRIHPPARELVARHLGAGKTKTEALRVLKRRLADVAYRSLLADAAHLSSEEAA